MSSTKEELPPPSKPRTSPLEYRNTDLVSRLLAATPPYLYNMPMIPNSYFFSEMLRSFVQAKTQDNRMHVPPPPQPTQHRRSRKRTWAQKEIPKVDTTTCWNQPPKTTQYYDNNKPEASEPYPANNQIEKIDNALLLPPPPTSTISSQESNLILPPPPPMWYPPIYPTPYGIDPLHFFIDLKVSGHIYDRKQSKEDGGAAVAATVTSDTQFPLSESVDAQPPIGNEKVEGFRPSRHASAFSVPTTLSQKNNFPMNLSSLMKRNVEQRSITKTKFDVKSMGFERDGNKTSINYIMNNMTRIYNDLREKSDLKKEAVDNQESDDKKEDVDERSETEEEREKRVRDLRALIGLELVVDYMNHGKPNLEKLDVVENDDDDSGTATTIEIVSVDDKDDC